MDKKESACLYREKNREKLRQDNKRYREENKELVLARKKSYREKNKQKISLSMKQYRLDNLEERRRVEIQANNLTYFGGMKGIVLERDKWSCVYCGLTNEEHLRKYGTMILVHHIDGKGKNAFDKNNSLDNLQTVCTSCHSRLHIRQRTKKHEKQRFGE